MESQKSNHITRKEYFTSNEVAEELHAYRSMFAYISRSKKNPVETCPVISLKPHNRTKIRFVIAGVAASIAFIAVFFNER